MTLGPTCLLVIVAPDRGSPAEKAGLRPGDLVLATDGKSVDGLSVDDARARIRGPKGSVSSSPCAAVTKRRSRSRSRGTSSLEQEVLSKAFGDGAVGYVQLRGFSDRAAADLTTALRAHLDAGRTKLILDLRGNPGGYVTAARVVASQFIGSGTIFWEQDADGSQIPSDSMPGGVATDPRIEVIALIDRGTASASEIVAAALQDSGRAARRAALVRQGHGPAVAGAARGGWRLPPDDRAWLAPSKRWIHNVGIEPDVAVALPADPLPGKDPTLDRALELIGVAPVGPLR